MTRAATVEFSDLADRLDLAAIRTLRIQSPSIRKIKKSRVVRSNLADILFRYGVFHVIVILRQHIAPIP